MELTKNIKLLPYETILDMYQEYRRANIWEPPMPFTGTFHFLKYGVELKRELQKRDKKRGSKVL